MKKAIAGIVTIVAAAVILNAQNSTSRPAGQGDSKPAASAPTSAATTIDPNAKYKIAMKYQPGKKYYVKLDMESEFTFDKGNGQQEKHPNKFGLTFYLDCQKKDTEGKMTAKLVFSHMSPKSASKADGPPSGDDEIMTNLLLAQNFTVYFATDGTIEKIDGAKELIKNMIASDMKHKPRDEEEAERFAKFLGIFITLPTNCFNANFSETGQTYADKLLPESLSNARILRQKLPEITLTLAEVANSPNGQIATIDLQAKNKSDGGPSSTNTSCLGQLKFNLSSNTAEYLRVETTTENINNSKMSSLDKNKAELTIKLVEKIPEAKAATSSPASQAASQPAK